MENISEHITYKEATRSNTAQRYGIKNTPNASQLQNMKMIANKVFEPVRNHFKVPIFVSSFYRSYLLNKKLGGSKTSAHTATREQAALDLDDVLGGVTNSEIFYYIKDNLEFDQLIWEYGDDEEPNWVHVSYRKTGNRNQVLMTETFINRAGEQKTKYVPFNKGVV